MCSYCLFDCEQICLPPKKKKRNHSELMEVDAKTVDAGRGGEIILILFWRNEGVSGKGGRK